jgi:hypothetical protein
VEEIAAVRASREDAGEPAAERRYLDEARVGSIRAEVEAALARAAVTDLLRAAVTLEDDRLDRLEGAVEGVLAGRVRGIGIASRSDVVRPRAAATGGERGAEGDRDRDP